MPRALADGVQEGTPLVHDGVMFMPNPNDVIQAVNAATGDLLWQRDFGVRMKMRAEFGEGSAPVIFGDALILIGLRYDSAEAREFAASLTRAMRDAAYRASTGIAREKGAFPLFD